jgi:hypothetical protein
MTGAQFEIRIDGTPRTYRDRKDYAMEAAEFYTADMEAVRATLQWLQENEDAVRAAVAKTESAS